MADIDTKTDTETLPTTRELVEENAQLKAENQLVFEQLGLVKHRLFAPSSEHAPTGQEALLFNEAEATALPDAPEPERQTITYTRRKVAGQRELNLSGLSVEEKEYRLPEEEQVCPSCPGHLHEMGADVRTEIKIVPATITVVKHIRTKYACRHCQNHELKTPIVTAPMPTTAFPNSLASPSAVAHIMTQKFVEGSPLYRQQAGFLRWGFELSRQTMANWMLTGASWLDKLYAHMKTHLHKRAIVHADETTLQVLKEEGRAAQTGSYMWLYRSGRDGPPIVLFEYQPTRASAHPAKFLKGYSGYLHVDGYVGYENLSNVTLVGCLIFGDITSVDTVGESKGEAHYTLFQSMVQANWCYIPKDRIAPRNRGGGARVAPVHSYLNRFANSISVGRMPAASSWKRSTPCLPLPASKGERRLTRGLLSVTPSSKSSATCMTSRLRSVLPPVKSVACRC